MQRNSDGTFLIDMKKAEDIAKCFVAWQRKERRPINLSQVKSFLRHLGPTVDNKLHLAASRQVYRECVKLIESGWLTTEECRELQQVK